MSNEQGAKQESIIWFCFLFFDSEVSWLPKKELVDIGITPEGKKRFAMANNQIVERDIGYAILIAEGYSTIDEVVFAEESEPFVDFLFYTISKKTQFAKRGTFALCDVQNHIQPACFFIQNSM